MNTDECGIAERLGRKLFDIRSQQELCARHLSRLLAEYTEPITPRTLRLLSTEAVGLTMRESR